MKRGILAVAGLAAAIWLSGCSSQDVNNLQSDTRKLGQDIGPAVGGAALDAKVHTHMALHKGIDMSGLHIEANGGTITLSGHVRDQGMRKKVVDVARETTGVDKVVDKLNVQH